MLLYKCDECKKVLKEPHEAICVGTSIMHGATLCDACGKDILFVLKDKKFIHGEKFKALEARIARLAERT